jgi:hypothetical protein
MKKMNLIFGDDLENASILNVPDYVHDCIYNLVLEFEEWFFDSEYSEINDVLFVEWLNANSNRWDFEESLLVESAVKYNLDYSFIEFG